MGRQLSRTADYAPSSWWAALGGGPGGGGDGLEDGGLRGGDLGVRHFQGGRHNVSLGGEALGVVRLQGEGRMGHSGAWAWTRRLGKRDARRGSEPQACPVVPVGQTVRCPAGATLD